MMADIDDMSKPKRAPPRPHGLFLLRTTEDANAVSVVSAPSSVGSGA